MATKFAFDAKQRFDCRDCPSRCCRLPVAIPLNSDEIARYKNEPWVQERVGDALSTVLISRYARCYAASEGRRGVTESDVMAGISIAELSMLGHASQRKAGSVMKNARRILIADRAMFLRVIGSENNETE